MKSDFDWRIGPARVRHGWGAVPWLVIGFSALFALCVMCGILG